MIEVLIVDDQKTVRNYLNMYLSEIPTMSIVGTANNGIEAIAMVEKHLPNIVLMDIEMPLMNGIQAAQIIAQRFDHIKVLLLTSKQEEQLLYQALKAGARGYILKSAKTEDLDKIIDLTTRGYLQFGPIIDKQNYSETAIVKTFPNDDAFSTLRESNMHETLLNLASNIIEIKKTVEFQQDKINRLSDIQSYEQRKDKKHFMTKSSSNRSFDINYKLKKISQSSKRQKFLFCFGFISGVITFAILLIILKIVS